MPTRQTRVLQLYPNPECPSHRRPVVLRLPVLTNIKQKLRVMLSFLSIIMIFRGGGFLMNIFLKRGSILLHIYLITTVVTVWHGNSLVLVFLPIFDIIFQGEISKGLVDFLVKLPFNTCKWRYSMAMFSPVNAGGVLKPDKEGC